MEILLKNRIRVKNYPDELLPIIVDKLQIINPKFQEAQASGRSVYNIEKNITNFSILPDQSLLLPRGVNKWLCNTAKTMGIRYVVDNQRKFFPYITIDSSKIIYRPYQYDGVIELITSATEGILVAPAGSGKTVMGLSLIALLGQPTLWLTHTGPLADQAIERANQFLPELGKIGMIGGGKWELGDILTIGMVQTLVRNPVKSAKMTNNFGTVILDEAHHCPASTFLEVVGHFNSHFMYGLTATPYRRDKLEKLMFHALGESITTIPIEKVSKFGGIMLPTVIYREIRSPIVSHNNIQKILTENIVKNTKRNRLIVGDVLREAVNGKYCIVISDRRAHCEALYSLISVGWEKTGIATGKYSKKYVTEQVEAFYQKKITVLVTTFSLLGEGFDVPFLDRAFICMPFRAEAKAVQLIGRIQRTYEGKTDAIVYDYVDINVGVLKNQFHNKKSTCRYRTYDKLGLVIKPF